MPNSRGLTDYPVIDEAKERYVCWCGKSSFLDDVMIIGGYHPDVGTNIHFAYSNGCRHSAPLTTGQYVFLGIHYVRSGRSQPKYQHPA